MPRAMKATLDATAAPLAPNGRDQGKIESDADDGGDDESAAGAARPADRDESATEDREHGEADRPWEQEEEGE